MAWLIRLFDLHKEKKCEGKKEKTNSDKVNKFQMDLKYFFLKENYFLKSIFH